MPTTKRCAVLLDVDGTLVDSNYFHALAWSRAFRRAGRTTPMASFHRLIGMYEREGFLREALEVARVGEKFGQCQGKVEELRCRLAMIEAEADAA